MDIFERIASDFQKYGDCNLTFLNQDVDIQEMADELGRLGYKVTAVCHRTVKLVPEDRDVFGAYRDDLKMKAEQEFWGNCARGLRDYAPSEEAFDWWYTNGFNVDEATHEVLENIPTSRFGMHLLKEIEIETCSYPAEDLQGMILESTAELKEEILALVKAKGSRNQAFHLARQYKRMLALV